MSEIHYFEGPQRIQREAVLDVLLGVVPIEDSDYEACGGDDAAIVFDAREIAAERVLAQCERAAARRVTQTILVLRRQGCPDLTLKIVAGNDPYNNGAPILS